LSSPGPREGFIGYVFSKSVWGKGYATETAAALVKFGFENLKLHSVFATCDPQNFVSAKVLGKVEMQKEGFLRQNYWVRGKWRDSMLFAILKNDFKTGQQNSTRHHEAYTSGKN
jgi:ribosomal-protein-alanine N-acetyltransferase